MIVCFCYWNLNINHKVMSHISWEVYGIVYISGVGNSDQIFSDSKLKTKTANTGKRMCFFLTGWVPSMCNTAPSTSYVLMTGNLGVSPRSTYTQRELPRMALEKHAPPPKQVNLGHIIPINYLNWQPSFQLLYCAEDLYLFLIDLRRRDFIQRDFLGYSFNNNTKIYSALLSHMLTQRYCLEEGKVIQSLSFWISEKFWDCHLTALVNGRHATISAAIFISIWQSKKVFSFETFNQYWLLFFFLNKVVGIA